MCVCVCVCVCGVLLICPVVRTARAVESGLGPSRPRTVGVRRGGLAAWCAAGRADAGPNPARGGTKPQQARRGPAGWGSPAARRPAPVSGSPCLARHRADVLSDSKYWGQFSYRLFFMARRPRNRTETASARSEHPDLPERGSPNRMQPAVPGSGVGYLKGLALRAAKCSPWLVGRLRAPSEHQVP